MGFGIRDLVMLITAARLAEVRDVPICKTDRAALIDDRQRIRQIFELDADPLRREELHG
jgi:hypothetical protein